MRITGRLVVLSLLCLLSAAASAQQETTVITDADAYVWSGTWGTDNRDSNYGTDEALEVMRNDNTFKTYIHFDLSGLDAGQNVTAANLRVAFTSAPAGADTSKIYAIVDDSSEWDLGTLAENAITYNNALQNDLVVPSMTTFLNTGTDPSAITRELATYTTDENDLDLDVTALVQWLLGQNAAYSDYVDSNRDLTIAWAGFSDYTYSNWRSKEDTLGDDSDAPRLVITQEGGVIPGDTNDDNCVDGADYTNWADNYQATGVPAWPAGRTQGNFNADDTVDGADYTIWADHYTGPCGQTVPEPTMLLLLGPGLVLAIRRRR